MEIEFRAFATFRATVGQKTFVREYDDAETVGDVLRVLSEEYPDLDLFDDDGQVPEFVSILKDGRDIAHIDGLETELEEGDTISLFPPVAGG
jgi:molybdopterin synthase sulfur carrier subunit